MATKNQLKLYQDADGKSLKNPENDILREKLAELEVQHTKLIGMKDEQLSEVT